MCSTCSVSIVNIEIINDQVTDHDQLNFLIDRTAPMHLLPFHQTHATNFISLRLPSEPTAPGSFHFRHQTETKEYSPLVCSAHSDRKSATRGPGIVMSHNKKLSWGTGRPRRQRSAPRGSWRHRPVSRSPRGHHGVTTGQLEPPGVTPFNWQQGAHHTAVRQINGLVKDTAAPISGDNGATTARKRRKRDVIGVRLEPPPHLESSGAQPQRSETTRP